MTVFDLMAWLFWIAATCLAMGGLSAIVLLVSLLLDDSDDGLCACKAWSLEEEDEVLYSAGWLHERQRCWPETS